MGARVDVEAAALFVGRGVDTVRKWVTRGLISRYPDGYDLDELQRRIDEVDTGKAVGGALAAHARTQADR